MLIFNLNIQFHDFTFETLVDNFILTKKLEKYFLNDFIDINIKLIQLVKFKLKVPIKSLSKNITKK